MEKENSKENFLADEEVRKLVIARLKVLSKDTIISLGSEGGFSRDELVKDVEAGNKVGEKLAEVQMEWLRSFKENITV